MGLEDELAKKYMEKGFPLTAAIELTCWCNLKCIHCYVVKYSQSPEEELSTEEIKNIIDQLAGEKVFTITFTGGEFFLRKDLFTIISYARENMFDVILYTNGTLIDSEIVRKIKELHVSSVEISLYGATALTHDKITRTNGSFEKTMNAIRLLKDSGIKVILKTIYMKQNFKEYKLIKEMGEKLGILTRPDVYITYKNDGDSEPAKYRLNRSELFVFLKNVYEKERGTGIWIEEKACIPREEKESIKERPYREFCGTGTIQCAISPIGKVFPCIGMPVEVGDLRKDTFHNIWWTSEKLFEIRNLRAIDEECYNCDIANLCGKCMGATFLEGYGLLACSPYDKEIAEMRKEVIRNETAI
ncbi:MAG: radical SAM protein [bacterium]